MERVLLDAVVMTDFRIFQLVWNARAILDGDCFAGQSNGLVGAANPDGVDLILSRRHGGSRVRITVSPWAPPDDPSWEDVVEVSVTIPRVAEHVRWVTFAGETSGALEIEPGDYRLRVSARGRDEVRFRPQEGAIDSYLLQLWREAPRPEEIVRVRSEDASYWNEQQGERLRATER